MEVNPYAAPLASTDVAPTGPAAVRVGFWPRLGASLVDTLIVVVSGVVISKGVAAAFPEYLAEELLRTQGKLDPKAVAALPQLSSWMASLAQWSMGIAIVNAGYHVLTEGMVARTVGKLVFGIRIADAQGRKATIPRLLARVGLKESGALLILLAILTNLHWLTRVAQVPSWIVSIGCFFVFAEHKRTLHDLGAGTAVYRNSDVVP